MNIIVRGFPCRNLTRSLLSSQWSIKWWLSNQARQLSLPPTTSSSTYNYILEHLHLKSFERWFSHVAEGLAITLQKLNNVGSALFCTSIPMWRQNEHQKSFPLLAFRDSSKHAWPIQPWWAVHVSCYLWRPKVENFFDAHIDFTLV